MQREKDVARVAQLAKQYAEQALAPILADGRATQINVTTDPSPGSGQTEKTGRLNMLIEVLAATGETLTFKHPVGVI